VSDFTPAGDDPEAHGPDRGRSRALVVALALAAVVVIAVVAIVVAPDGGADEYNDEVEENFLAACTEDGGDDVAPVCACLYAQIVEKIPYDRFEEVNDALEAEQAADDEGGVRLPADFDRIRVGCVEEEGVEATTTTAPPTTAPPATATPTAPPTTAAL
jgi:hypothetical protein